MIRQFSRLQYVFRSQPGSATLDQTTHPDALTVRESRDQEHAENNPQPTKASAGFQIRMSIERLLYVIIGLLAVLTRFWDLSSRAMNHDESLHTYYSWLFYKNFQYIHDPLMHGPALFHMNALAYFLFGDNDFTSRIVPALFGVMIVLMPALLRRPQLLGRWGALAASTFLLFSPAILYYSRFIRHDIYTLFATFAIVIAALRYLEKPERRWLVLAGFMTGFLFSTKEVSFIVAFILVSFIAGIVTWQIHRALFGVLIATGLGIGLTVVGLHRAGVQPLPGIPWEDPDQRNIRQFAFDLASHPIVLASLGVLGLGVVAGLFVIERIRDREDGGWLHSVFSHTRPYSTAHSLYRAFLDKRGMQIAIIAGISVYLVLYTSLFTNLGGIGSSSFGALAYWLGQQDVQRGAQPWFYYLLLIPQYEFIAVVVFPIAGFITAKQLVPKLLSSEPVARRLYMRGFFLYWAVVMLAVLSWAGEKMPWLSLHVILPMLLLAASFAGEAIEAIETRVRSGNLAKIPAIAVASGVPLLAGIWFVVWAWGTSGPWMYVEDTSNYVRTLQPSIADKPWLLYLPALALVILGLYAVMRLGSRTALAVLGTTCIGIMLLAQAHVAYRFTYEEGDVPVDMLMYSQESPDVTMVMDDLGELSRLTTGGKDLRIWYDSGTSWPFQWYLRNYTNRRFYGASLTSPPDADIVLIASENVPDSEQMLTGYTYQEYTMRWFFPENPTYRRFAYAPELNDVNRRNLQNDQTGPYSVLDVAKSVGRSLWSLHAPAEQAKMFRLVAYRELWDQIRTDYYFRVYVRNDLLATYNSVRY